MLTDVFSAQQLQRIAALKDERRCETVVILYPKWGYFFDQRMSANCAMTDSALSTQILAASAHHERVLWRLSRHSAKGGIKAHRRLSRFASSLSLTPPAWLVYANAAIRMPAGRMSSVASPVSKPIRCQLDARINSEHDVVQAPGTC